MRVREILKQAGQAEEASAWAVDYGDDLPRAIRDCPRSDWLVRLLEASGHPRGTLLLVRGRWLRVTLEEGSTIGTPPTWDVRDRAACRALRALHFGEDEG